MSTSFTGLTTTVTTVATSDILAGDVSGVTAKITAGNLRKAFFGFNAADPLNCGPLTATGNSTITGTLGGITTLSCTSLVTTNLTANVTGNVTGSSGSCTGNAATATTAAACSGNAATATSATTAVTVTQAAQAAITSVGTLTSITTSGAITMTAAASRIVPGATSFAIRNTANGRDNLLVADNGDTTIFGNIQMTAGAALLGTSGHQLISATYGAGYAAMTGTPDSGTSYATSTITTAQLAGRVMALQASLTGHGLIGA